MRKLIVLATGRRPDRRAAAPAATSRARPDEFAVARQAPLVMPPDYCAGPARPGRRARSTARPCRARRWRRCSAAPRCAAAAKPRAIGQAGASPTPAIRSDVGDPDTIVVDKGATTRDIVAAPEGDGQDARAATKPKQ